MSLFKRIKSAFAVQQHEPDPTSLSESELNDYLETLRSRLIKADTHIATVDWLLARTQKLLPPNPTTQVVVQTLKSQCLSLLKPCQRPFTEKTAHQPHLLLVVGINGSGKTTTIAKLANFLKNKNQRVMLAAGDTFRAGAIEQLKVWGQRLAMPVIAQKPMADSASVIFDAYQSAKSKAVDWLIADTAGRLHNQAPLMQELVKVCGVAKKLDKSAPHDVFLVLDGSLGQTTLKQVESFRQSIELTGIIMTKLDGSAKGGCLLGLAHQMKVPIVGIGLGEQLVQFQPFNATDFVDAFLSEMD
jgi:fused signal recognition particle receptor